MGKLNIAHHKSYHPYRLDNIERVRKDEEAARLKEEGQESRMRQADSEARLALLRGRAGGSKKVKRIEDEEPQLLAEPVLTTLTTSTGHINLFADFEQHAMSSAMVRVRETATAKGSAKTDDEKGVRLAPSTKDLNPWYIDRRDSQHEEIPEDKRMKDLTSKSAIDPLTSIQSALQRPSPFSGKGRGRPPPALPAPASHVPTPAPHTSEARLQRESSERARAQALIRRKQQERERAARGMADMTPSSVGGGDSEDRSGGYGDVYNRQETEAAYRRRRERGGGWGRGRVADKPGGEVNVAQQSRDRDRRRYGEGDDVDGGYRNERSYEYRDRRW